MGLAFAYVKIWRRARTTPADETELLFAMLFFTIASPIAWFHHYGFLPAVFACVTPVAWPARWWTRCSLALFAGIWLICAHDWLITNVASETAWNFLQSGFFFAVLALMALMTMLRWRMRNEAIADIWDPIPRNDLAAQRGSSCFHL